MKKLLIVLLFSAGIFLSANAQTMSAGRDTTICPGNVIKFTSWADTISSDYFYFRWQPSDKVTDSTSIAPYAYPDSTTTFYFYAYKPDANNLVFNGDFEQGNTGFWSQYDYKVPSGTRTLWGEGTWTIASRASDVHENFTSQYDHTYGASQGQYMIVNGSLIPNIVVWSQTITSILPNTDYVFYAWAMSVHPTDPAVLQFRINNELLDVPYVLSPDPVWSQFYTIWNSGSATSAVITLVNQAISKSGNDFGLDDVFFAPIYPDVDSVTVHMLPSDSVMTKVMLCHNQSYVFNDKMIVVESGLYVDTLKTIYGCDSITYLDITFMPPVEADLGEKQVWCRSEASFVELSPGLNYHVYEWNTGSTSPIIQVQETGLYSVTVSDSIGCKANAEVEIVFVENPDVKIISDTEDFCENYKMTLSVETDAPEIMWSTGETTSSIEVTQFGKYTVRVTDEPCSVVDTFVVEFCCPKDHKLPNVITPSDHNGINDYFEFPDDMPYEMVELYVYDKWGKRVFKSTGADFKWDGTVGGKIVPGVYYWVIHLKDGCSFHGSLTVL